LDLVNETIDLFLSRGAKYLHINDDNFYVNFDRAISILEHANIPSFSEIRIPTLLKDNRIKTLKDLKCKKLMSGAESCDNEILKKIQKGQTYEQMIHAAELFSKYKEIQPSWSFIIGMPIESLQTIKKTINGKQTLEKIAGRNVGPIGIYIPYPGSPMYQEALRKGFKEKREPLEWGVFERYGFNGREFPPDHEAYPWINVKEIWRLALKDYKEINMKVTMPISLKDRFRNYLSEKKKYKEYLRVQLERSKSKYNIKNELEEKRKEYFTDLVSSQVDPGNLKDTLVIGCRNPYEIDLLRKKGLNNVIGIDIFSNDRRIKVMDMHNLKFNDDSFDMIYCSHALEHAYDYEKVMLEMIRVLRNQAVIAIEVPVNYETRGSDIHDFQSSANLIGIFTFHVKIKEVFFSVDLKKGEAYNFSGTDIARVIFSINKS